MEDRAPGLDRLAAHAAAARAGGRPEIEALLAASAGMAHALARARLGDTHAAEEATVETLRRIAQGLPKLKDAQAYPRWLAKIAAHAAAATAGKKRRPLVSTPQGAEPADPNPGPAEALQRNERAAAIRTAVSGLKRTEREIVHLHFVEDLSYRDIARTLGIGLGTVARRMQRALCALEQTLGDLA